MEQVQKGRLYVRYRRSSDIHNILLGNWMLPSPPETNLGKEGQKDWLPWTCCMWSFFDETCSLVEASLVAEYSLNFCFAGLYELYLRKLCHRIVACIFVAVCFRESILDFYQAEARVEKLAEYMYPKVDGLYIWIYHVHRKLFACFISPFVFYEYWHPKLRVVVASGFLVS